MSRASDLRLVTSVGDREADRYELLAEAIRHRDAGPHLLVRSRDNRQLVLNLNLPDPLNCFGRSLRHRPSVAGVVVELPQRHPRQHSVTFEIRYQTHPIQVPAQGRPLAL